ncbi:MAG: hypothetical protein DRJ56_01505 [Thermoprotei archaeon]|nr:MAG: hypothetical protein DRJ56_01505 [Thermoprotei archaeon]
MGRRSPAKAWVLALALALSITLNVLLAVSLYEVRLEHQAEIGRLVEEYNRLVEENKRLRDQLSVLKRTLEMLSRQAETQEAEVSLEGYDWIPIVGIYVRSLGLFHEEVTGIVMRAYVKLVPGSGRVFISTSPKIGIDLQRAAEVAYKVALAYAGVSGSYDVMIVITANETVNVVDGPSAGGALAAIIAALLTNKTVKKDVVMTGTIEPDGRIGPVGGVYEKAIAAARYGAKLFLVPRGQSVVRVLKPEVVKIGPGFKLVKYKAVMVSLEEELRRQGYDIKVREVGTLSEALSYFLQEAG